MAGQRVDSRAVAVWRWESLLRAVLVIVPAGVVALTSQLPALPAFFLLLLLALVLAGWAWWYPRARYRHLGYTVNGTGIVIREGVFWRVQSALARARIQHTDVYQGPLQRHYGIATLKLYTAGSNYTKIELPGLAHETAIALREALQREGGGDAV